MAVVLAAFLFAKKLDDGSESEVSPSLSKTVVLTGAVLKARSKPMKS